MARDWTSFVELAQRLIDKNGRSVAVQRLSNTPADATRPWRGAATPTVAQSVTCQACFLPPVRDEFGRAIASEDMLASIDQIALIAQQSTDIEKFDTIADGGLRHRILWVWTLKPGDTILLYAFGVHR